MALKFDKAINLQQLLMTLGSVLVVIVIFAFSLKSDVGLNARDIQLQKTDIQELKDVSEKKNEKLEASLDEIKNSLMEIKLALKDKQDRSGN